MKRKWKVLVNLPATLPPPKDRAGVVYDHSRRAGKATGYGRGVRGRAQLITMPTTIRYPYERSTIMWILNFGATEHSDKCHTRN